MGEGSLGVAEMGRWGDGEMGDGEMERWGDGDYSLLQDTIFYSFSKVQCLRRSCFVVPPPSSGLAFKVQIRSG